MGADQQTVLEHPNTSDMLGKRFGKYRAVRELGRGGMGAVYEVVHEEIGGRAAVKVLHRQLVNDSKAVARFFDEARAVRGVDHPGLVRILDFDQLTDGTVYILMEFLAGESLWERLERLRAEDSALPLPEVLRVVRQVASALSAVHKTGVVHRDLKPENVLLVPDPDLHERAKVLDFGIAKFIESEDRRTTTGTLVGTPYYMSPEQCQGGALSDRSDVYALGVLLHELIAGKLPFTGAAMRVIANHMFQEPPRLRELRPETPPELEALVLRMLAKQPDERPNMAQVVAAIDGMAPTGPSLPVIRGTRGAPRGRWLAVAAALLALAGAGSYLALRQRGPVPTAQGAAAAGSPAQAPTAPPRSGAAAAGAAQPGTTPALDPAAPIVTAAPPLAPPPASAQKAAPAADARRVVRKPVRPKVKIYTD